MTKGKVKFCKSVHPAWLGYIKECATLRSYALAVFILCLNSYALAVFILFI